MFEKRGRTVWEQVARRVGALQHMADTGRQKAELAKLRHGIGRSPGDDPTLWALLFEDLPENMLSRNGEPTREEWAIYIAMTLFALHQQGRDPVREPMSVEGRSLGGAAAVLVSIQGEDARPRIARRFNQAATATAMAELVHYLRELIQLFRSEGIGLDYARLAADLYSYQDAECAPNVRLQWGQDFYFRKDTQLKDNGKDDQNG